MLKIGDRVRWVGGKDYGPDWNFMLGATATVVEHPRHPDGLFVKWDDHADDEPAGRLGALRWYTGEVHL